MKIGDKERQRVIDHINKKWGADAKCPVCKHNSWTVPDEVYEFREYKGGGIAIGGKNLIIPIFPVTCDNCGNTILFNALVLKIPVKREK